MNSMFVLRDNWLNWLLRVLVGGAFLAAGVLKVLGPAAFADAVANYRAVPHVMTHLVAITVPWIEIIAGLMVLTGFWLRPATLLINAMTVMFFVLITSALARGLDIHCGCFGTVGGRNIGLQNLAIDTALFCLSFWLLMRIRQPAQPAAGLTPAPAT